MTDLKEKNEPKLKIQLLVAIVPVYLSVYFLHSDAIWGLIENKSIASVLQLTAIGLTPLACLKVVLMLLSGQMSRGAKERLVHLRWKDPLPGGRANKLIKKDARIDLSALPSAAAELMDDSLSPRDRNAKWYINIYVPVRDIAAVSNTHRQYLLHRDAASGVFALLILIGFTDLILSTAYGFPIMTWPAYVGHTFYLISLIAVAYQEGNRMVTGATANFIASNNLGE